VNAFTLNQEEARAPTKLLPSRAAGVRVEQVSAFYDCLSFRLP
jgi:hypothetical protein